MNKVTIPAVLLSFVAAVLIFGSAPAMADSEGTKSYKKHWAIPIGSASGELEITEDTDKDELLKSVMPLEEVVANYSDIDKARLGKAVNDDGKYFLVWKLVSTDYDAESDTKIRTFYVLDAKTGNQLIEPMTKEGGSCGDKDKSDTTKTSGENA